MSDDHDDDDTDKCVPFTLQSILSLERAGKFPKRRRIGANRIGYLRHEVEQWLATRSVVKPVAEFAVSEIINEGED